MPSASATTETSRALVRPGGSAALVGSIAASKIDATPKSRSWGLEPSRGNCGRLGGSSWFLRWAAVLGRGVEEVDDDAAFSFRDLIVEAKSTTVEIQDLHLPLLEASYAPTANR